MANWPTGPQPQIAIVSSGLGMLQKVGRHVTGSEKMSEKEQHLPHQFKGSRAPLERTDIGP